MPTSLPALPIRAFQWDLARQVERLEVLLRRLPDYARWGYQELYLHLEDAVHYPSLPGVGRDDAYSYAELQELVRTAEKSGIRVVPIVNLLGHTQYLIKSPEWRDLNELRAEDGSPLDRGQVCPLHPRFEALARKLVTDMAPFCTAGKIHVGLDESFHLGKCPRCRNEIAKVGLAGHFARHVGRLEAVCRSHSLKMGIWADMLYFVPDAIPQLPRGITAYDWYYYGFARKPRVEFFNFAERDLAPALRRQGIAYYGCPMNGAFRHEPLPVFGDRLGNINAWWSRCLRVKAEGFLITSWEPNRLALETTTVVDAAAASLWLDGSSAPHDHTALLAAGLSRALKIKQPSPLARSLLAADSHAFSGYGRWQINERWDVFAGQESVQPYRDDVRFFARLETQTRHAPVVIAASVAFRLYLAERDLVVREAARTTFKLRRLWTKGRIEDFNTVLTQFESAWQEFGSQLTRGSTAARQMWKRSRDPRASSPNETVLAADRKRLTTILSWIQSLRRSPERIMDNAPLCGAWQLQFMVHNLEPAVQRVSVERETAPGIWQEVSARYTIEFRTSAARPRSKVKREFTVPVDGLAQALRVVLKGVGRVAISHVTVTNGIAIRKFFPYRQRKWLGRKAPSTGFPDPTAIAEPLTLTRLQSAD